jgi:general secretion pathway protein H
VRVRQQRGFTLIEIMLVLVVISVMAGLATVALGPNPYKELAREARRLQAVLQMAADEAVLQGAQWALALPEQGYQFLVFDSEKFTWNSIDKEPFNVYQLDQAITLALSIEGEQFDPEALEQIQRMQALNKDQALQPVLLLLSSGEITPFSITLRNPDLDGGITLISDGVSPIEFVDGVKD